jgi:AraC-like DNA-binding protein
MADIEGNLGSNDGYLVCWTRSGYLSFDRGHQTVQTPLHTPQLMPGGDTAIISKAHNVDLNGLQIDKEFVRDVALGLEEVRFTTFDVATPKPGLELTQWRRVVDLVATVIPDSRVEPTPLLRREMSRLVAVSMLDTFSYQAMSRLPTQGGTEPISVRVAYEFAEFNADLAIGASDIARAAGLSVRAIQHALRRHKGTTPTALVKSFRLCHVRETLLRAQPIPVTVSSVARDWGFVHLGRFAADYRDAFGELPGQTLKRAT